MKYWIVPSNDNVFQIQGALQAQGGLVDWRMSNNFAVGDKVFVYIAKPEHRIRYQMDVVAVGLKGESVLDQERFWVDKDTYFAGMEGSVHARFMLVMEYMDDRFSLFHLRQHGLRGNLQSARECKEGELLDYLAGPNPVADAAVYGVDYPPSGEKLFEGALIKVMANKYERNQKARKECIVKKGCKCSVCGFDFGKMYGEFARGFIHVHHLVPISSVGEKYELDVERDMVPVCPNCHCMLHRKNPPYSIEELKGMITTAKLAP